MAEAIAQRVGAPVEAKPFTPVLRGLLLTGTQSRYLRADPTGVARVRADVDEDPRPHPGRAHSDASTRPLWWPPAKIAGRYLAPYLATARPRPLAASPLRDRPAPPPGAQPDVDPTEACELALLIADHDAHWGDYASALRALEQRRPSRASCPPSTRTSAANGARQQRPDTSSRPSPSQSPASHAHDSSPPGFRLGRGVRVSSGLQLMSPSARKAGVEQRSATCPVGVRIGAPIAVIVRSAGDILGTCSGSTARTGQEKSPFAGRFEADDGSRTRDLRLGKPTLYQLSYVRNLNG